MSTCVRQLGASCIPSRSRSRAKSTKRVDDVLRDLPLDQQRSGIELRAAISTATHSADSLKVLRKTYRAEQKESLKHVWYYRHWHRKGTAPPMTCTKPLQGRLKHNRSFQNHKRELEASLIEAKSRIVAVEAGERPAGAAMLDTQEVAELRSKKLYRKAKVDR